MSSIGPCLEEVFSSHDISNRWKLTLSIVETTKQSNGVISVQQENGPHNLLVMTSLASLILAAIYGEPPLSG